MRKLSFDDAMDTDVRPISAFGYFVLGLSLLVSGLLIG